MRPELARIEEVERYLAGRMSNEEAAAFELELSGNESAREEAGLQQQIVDRIQLNAFREDVLAYHAAHIPNAARLNGNRWLLSLIGLVFVAASAFAVYYTTRSDNNPEGEKHAAIGSRHQKRSAVKMPAPAPAEPKQLAFTRSFPNDRVIQQHTSEATTSMERFFPVMHTQIVDNSRDFYFQMADSKSLVCVPANCMTDALGNEITGEVEIRYREYRDPAQMAFSQIPMTYDENGTSYQFNSAGMFEIRAYQDGKELNMKPEQPIVVDYKVTSPLTGCHFYRLKDDKWFRLRDIQFGNNIRNSGEGFPIMDAAETEHDPGKLFVEVYDQRGKQLKNARITATDAGIMRGSRYQVISSDSGYMVNHFNARKVNITIRCKGFKTLKTGAIPIGIDSLSTITAVLITRNGKLPQTSEMDSLIKRVDTPSLRSRKHKLFQRYRYKSAYNAEQNVLTRQQRESKKDEQQEMVRQAQIGHMYPDMVKGLQCPEFGIYNCDQAYRLADKVEIKATYTDENGNILQQVQLLSMIDLKYNGAFSFAPENFTFSASGRNVLLLFTGDKKLYAIREEDLAAMKIKTSGSYAFKMTNITGTVRDANELKKFLGISAPIK